MFHRKFSSRNIFLIFNAVVLFVTGVICLFPLLHTVAVSLSEGWAADAGIVGVLPIGFTLKAYEFVLDKQDIIRAFCISLERVLIGVPLNMLLTILVSYPLSKSGKSFRGRQYYVGSLMVAMLFNGGLIPTYVVVYKTGLINSILSLILPCAVQVFNIIVLHNFFKELPGEIEESAFIDGAGYWTTLWKIIVPLSKPSLATLTLFSFVFHWNSWFDGIIYMNRPENYPLQSYLQTVVVQLDMQVSAAKISYMKEMLVQVSQKNANAAKIFISIIPVLVVYPFLQRYFVKGIILGSVKG